MPGLPITITNAGRAALINAQNTGSAALAVSQVGVSATHAGGDLTALAALPGEIKRLATFAGDVVADDVLHLTIRDETAAAYSLRSFALYLSNGVLFAVYSQATPIMEKSAAATLLLATDVALKTLTTAAITFGETDFINPPATTDTPGVIEIATQAEVEEGIDASRAVTPLRLKGLLTALLGLKSNIGHQHDAADVVSGVFNVGRIPALAMEKITGLAAALAATAKLAGAYFVGAISAPNIATNGAGIGGASLNQGSATNPGYVQFFTADGIQRGFVGWQGSAQRLRISSENGWGWDFNERPIFNGATPWDTLNFTPSTKADLAGAAFTGPISSEQLGVFGVNTGKVYITRGQADRPGYISFQDKDGNERGFAGWRYDVDGQAHNVLGGGWAWYFPNRPNFAGATPWDSANFNPAAKASLAGASFTGAISMPALHIKGAAGSYRELTWRTGESLRWDLFADTSPEAGGNVGSNLILARYDDAGNGLGVVFSVGRANGRMDLAQRPTWAGVSPWDSGNFNPADKAPALHTHDWAQVTGRPPILTYRGTTTEDALDLQTTPGWLTVEYAGFSRLLQTIGNGGSVGPLQQEWHYSLNSGGWRIRNMQDSIAWGAWSYVVLSTAHQGVINGTIYHSGNFNPAGKSDVGHTHTTSQITDLLDVVWPAGELRLFDYPAVPFSARCLVANGATVSRSTYSRLFAVIGVRYGAGDGATTFQLPDWRGLFFRGLDNGRGVDPGRSLGTTQSSQNLGHDHTVGEGSNSQALSGSFNGYTSGDDFTSLAAGYSTTGSSGGNEARPINTALLACITY